MMIEPEPFQYWCTKCEWIVRHEDCLTTHKQYVVIILAEQLRYCVKRLVSELRYTDRLQTVIKSKALGG